MMNLYERKATKPLKAIRLFCGECMGMDRQHKKAKYPIEDVKQCSAPMCPLFEWRLGINPYKSKIRVEIGRKLAEKRKLEVESKS